MVKGETEKDRRQRLQSHHTRHRHTARAQIECWLVMETEIFGVGDSDG